MPVGNCNHCDCNAVFFWLVCIGIYEGWEVKKVKNLITKYGGNRFMKTVVAGGVTAVSLMAPAFATSGETETVTVSNLITSNWPAFVTLVANIWQLLTANPLLAFLVTVGIAFAGFRIMRVAMRIARR